MATTINQTPTTGENTAMTVLAVVIVALLAVVLAAYAVPALRNAFTSQSTAPATYTAPPASNTGTGSTGTSGSTSSGTSGSASGSVGGSASGGYTSP